MPRIRTIKPEFWTDPVMVQLDPLARLFYIGTWNFAMCDQGHIEDDPFRLKLQILPAENCDVESLINTLVKVGRLTRLEVDGDKYLHVRKLAEHQKVDGRWAPRCPVCKVEASPELTETPASLDETHRDSPKLPPVREGKGREGKGEGAASRARRSPERPIPDDWKPNTGHQVYANEHGLDLPTEAFKFRNHAIANDRRQRDWDASFRMWLAKAKDYAPKGPRQIPQGHKRMPEAWL
jgi:hypothetical protein